MTQLRLQFFCILMLCLLSPPLQGQEGKMPADSLDRDKQAIRHIIDMKEGVLLVRLPSFSNQLEVLEQSMKGKRRNRRLQKRKEGLLADRKNFARHLMTAFRDTFSFSRVMFMYDTAMTQLLDGRTSGFLLDENLELDPQLALPKSKPVYTLRIGLTDYETSTRRMAMIVTDAENNDLQRPFPYARAIFQLEPFNLKRTFGISDFYNGMDERWALQLVGGMHAKFMSFYEQVKKE